MGVRRRELRPAILGDVKVVEPRVLQERAVNLSRASVRRHPARVLHSQDRPRVIRVQLDRQILALDRLVLAPARLLEGLGRVVGHGLGVRFDAVRVFPRKLGEGLALDEEVDDAVEDADVGDADCALGPGG